MYAIQTKQLKKVYKNNVVVNNLDINVPYGSVYGFLGPNGAGKTTTIRMLTGLARPNSGEIYISSNKVLFNSTKYKYDLGFVPDVPAFYKWMTAYEYLLFCGQIYNMKSSEIKVRAKQLLDMVGLENDRKAVGSYSRGMKQRLGIAQALIHRPKVVILDEPTSALDPIGRKDVLELIGKLSSQVTVFFSTHILNDVENICDRVCVLNHGNLILEDSIVNLKSKYYKSSFYLETSAPVEEVSKALTKYDYITDIQCQDNGVDFRSKNIEGIEKLVPFILHENRWSLKEFRRNEPSLENIFMEVLEE